MVIFIGKFRKILFGKKFFRFFFFFCKFEKIFSWDDFINNGEASLTHKGYENIRSFLEIIGSDIIQIIEAQKNIQQQIKKLFEEWYL